VLEKHADRGEWSFFFFCISAPSRCGSSPSRWLCCTGWRVSRIKRRTGNESWRFVAGSRWSSIITFVGIGGLRRALGVGRGRLTLART